MSDEKQPETTEKTQKDIDLDKINQEYGQACAQIGHLTRVVRQNQKKLHELVLRVDELNAKADALQAS